MRSPAATRTQRERRDTDQVRSRRVDAQRRITPIELDDDIGGLCDSEVPDVGIQRRWFARFCGLTQLRWHGGRNGGVGVGEKQDVRALPEWTDDRSCAEITGIGAKEQEW
jgi:hypothetical protein